MRLGFGYQAYFSTMRFLMILCVLMILGMMAPAFRYYRSAVDDSVGFSGSWFFDSSYVNMDYSGPVCEQQYVLQNTTRTIDCAYGGG